MVLDGLDFWFEVGDVMVVIGFLGCGKSILFYILGMLELLILGVVCIDDVDLFGLLEVELVFF